MNKPSRNERLLITLIITLNLILGTTYALVTPAFEASDELWHYPMVRHLADGNPLPVQVFDPALAGPWNQEASQPPLYYYLGAALTFWIDQSDMEQVRWLNPHVDNGVLTPDGNINLAIHDPAADPWQGALLGVRLVRLFSVLLGAATIYLTYLIAREVAPNRPAIALAAAGLNAFLPMFLFISGAVNNDNLAVPLASLALLLMIRIVTRRTMVYSPVSVWAWLWMGVVIGLAVLTKQGAIGLIPMALGTAVVAAWQYWLKSGNGMPPKFPPTAGLWAAVRQLVVALLIIALPILAIAGWWYYRNIVLYGDWLGWNAFIAVLGQRAHPASLDQLWGERYGFMMSFWGLFGGVNVPMAAWVYSLLNWLLIFSVIGFAFYFIRLAIKEWQLFRDKSAHWFARLLSLVERNFGLIVVLLFTVAVIFGLIQWATTTWSSQGRLVFTAISAIMTLTALGWAGLLDTINDLIKRVFARDIPGLHRFGLAIPVVCLFVVAAAAPWLSIRPAYAYQGVTPSESLSERLSLDFGGSIKLAGYEVEYNDPRPGSEVIVRLEWEVLSQLDRDWSVFIHLNDPVLGRPIAQRDMYPGRGLLATRLLVPGMRIIDEYVLAIPSTAVAPADLDLVIGLYDFTVGDRLVTDEGQDSYTLTTIRMVPGMGSYPNPVSQFFEFGLELVGFSVEPRATAPGANIELITYWRPSEPLPADYTFFAQIVGKDTTRYAAADITPPQPTGDWRPHEVYPVTFPLVIDPATPPDVYPLIIGLYTMTAAGDFERLQQVTPDGRLTDDFLVLTQIKIEP